MWLTVVPAGGHHWVVVWAVFAAVAAAAYACGCFNGSVIVSKYILKDDVRTHGSGNAGLTNFHRTFGGKLTGVVLGLDVVKMVVAVAVAAVAVNVWLSAWGVEPGPARRTWLIFAKYWAGLWCLLGHMFPCTFGFKGGKGILSGVTLLFCVDYRMGLIALALFVVIVALTRYISLGSICATASFPVTTVLFVSREMAIVLLAGVLALLVIWMHRSNIRRLSAGTENKFSLHRKKT